MPLDQHVEGGHGEGEPGVKILPHTVHDFLEVADDGQHREHRFYQHPVLPLAPRGSTPPPGAVADPLLKSGEPEWIQRYTSPHKHHHTGTTQSGRSGDLI